MAVGKDQPGVSSCGLCKSESGYGDRVPACVVSSFPFSTWILEVLRLNSFYSCAQRDSFATPRAWVGPLIWEPLYTNGTWRAATPTNPTIRPYDGDQSDAEKHSSRAGAYKHHSRNHRDLDRTACSPPVRKTGGRGRLRLTTRSFSGVRPGW